MSEDAVEEVEEEIEEVIEKIDPNKIDLESEFENTHIQEDC